jgi:transposase-like protein
VVTNEDLEAAAAEVERLKQPYSAAVEARQALVKQALKQGMRQAHVARKAGISPQAVEKLR